MKLRDVEYRKKSFPNLLSYLPRFELYYEFPIDDSDNDGEITEELFADRELQYYYCNTKSLEIIKEQSFHVLVYMTDLLLAQNFLSTSEILSEVLSGVEILCEANDLELLEINPITCLDFTELSKYKHFNFPIYKNHYIYVNNIGIAIVPLPKDLIVHLSPNRYYEIKVKRK